MEFVHVEGGVGYPIFGSIIGWVAGHSLEIDCVGYAIYFFIALLGNEWIQLSVDLRLTLLIRIFVHRNQPSLIVHTLIRLLSRIQRRNTPTVLVNNPTILVNTPSFSRIIVQPLVRGGRLLRFDLNQHIIFELALLDTLFGCIDQSLTILHSFLPLPFIVTAVIPIHLAISRPQILLIMALIDIASRPRKNTIAMFLVR